MGYTIKPSIGMLPMEDISNVLQEEGFIKNLSSKDIEAVTATTSFANGNVVRVPGISDPSRIAICANNAVNGTIDRETVKNALNLNGKPASDYLSGEDKDNIYNINNNIINIYSNEIQLLRDELYVLKNSLIKNGHIEDVNVAKGYIDPFKTINIRYNEDFSNILSATNTSLELENNFFKENDWIILNINPNNEESIIDDSIKTINNNYVALKKGVANIEPSVSIIKKNLGEYKNGTYSFSKTEKDAVGTKDRYTGLNDDVTLKETRITESNSGFSTSIRIPNKQSGFLTKFIIQGKKVGEPGIMVCYAIKGNKDVVRELANNNSLSDYLNNAQYIAKSQTVSTYDKQTGEIVFEFENTTLESKYLYPEVIGGQEYTFIIEAFDCDENNYWSIEFGNNNSNDLQTNNTSYKFYRKSTTSSNKELVSFDDYRDLFYTAITRSKEDELEIPYKYGLYSTKDEIKLSTPIKATRARLTLEVNKEGNLITSTNGLVEENRDFIYFSNIDGTNSGQIIMNIGDQVVIGENIVTVTSATSSSIMVDKTIYVKDDTPIYRVAYDAKISTKLVKIDEESHLETIVDGSENIYNLTLKSVIANGNNNSNFSDRLVFETDSDIELKEFNKVDLQIRWHSNLTSEVLKAQLLKDNDCVGRIKTLSLTFDEKLNNI